MRLLPHSNNFNGQDINDFIRDALKDKKFDSVTDSQTADSTSEPRITMYLGNLVLRSE